MDIADSRTALSQFVKAEFVLNDTLKMAREVGCAEVELYATKKLSNAKNVLGDVAKSVELLDRTVTLLRQMGRVHEIPLREGEVAVLRHKAGLISTNKALAVIRRSLWSMDSMFEHLTPVGLANLAGLEINVAVILLGEERFEEGREIAAVAVERAAGLEGMHEIKFHAKQILANALAGSFRELEAIEIFEAIEEETLHRYGERSKQAVEMLINFADLLRQSGFYERALDMNRRVVRAWRTASRGVVAPNEMILAAQAVARCLILLDRGPEAVSEMRGLLQGRKGHMTPQLEQHLRSLGTLAREFRLSLVPPSRPAAVSC